MTDDHDLYWRNRRLFADRQQWPDGALRRCELIQWEHPGWITYWSAGPVGDPRPGYYAVRDHADFGERPAFGATPYELVAAVEERPVRERGFGSFDSLPVSER